MKGPARNIAFLLSLLSAPSFLLAQEDLAEHLKNIRGQLATATINVSGSTNPEAIPDGEILAIAFERLRNEQQILGKDGFQQEFNARHGGSNADAQRISRLLDEDRAFRARVEEEQTRNMNAFCARLLGPEKQTMAAIEIASSLTAIADRRLSQLEKHYRSAIEELSPQARLNLMSQIEATVVPSIGYVSVDYMALAALNPDYLKSWWISACERQERLRERELNGPQQEPRELLKSGIDALRPVE